MDKGHEEARPGDLKRGGSGADAIGKSARRRRHLGLSLRGMTLLLFALCGCLVWHAESRRAERAAVASVRRAGGHVSFERARRNDPPTVTSEPPWLDWLRIVLGEDLLRHPIEVVVGPNAPADTQLEQIGRLEHLELLSSPQSNATDLGLRHIARLRELKELHLVSTEISSDGISELRKLTNLESLFIVQAPVTDVALKYLRELPHLRELVLMKTRVTRQAVEQLKRESPGLCVVFLDNSVEEAPLPALWWTSPTWPVSAAVSDSGSLELLRAIKIIEPLLIMRIDGVPSR